MVVYSDNGILQQGGCGWLEEAQWGFSRGSGGDLLLDLGAGFVGMFTWWMLRKLYPYDHFVHNVLE